MDMTEKTVYTGHKGLFYNANCIFIEYHDVLSMPWYTMLSFVKSTTVFSDIIHMETIRDYDLEGLLEWYVYRKYRNVFKSLGGIHEGATDEIYDILLEKAMGISPDLYKIPIQLKFLTTLRLLMSEPGLVNKVIIYSEKDEAPIKEEINKYFSNVGAKIQYMCGNFTDVLKLVPADSTFVFSDIEKINVLVKEKRLNCTAILIVNGLRYNYKENDHTKLKVDLDSLLGEYIFKYSFFDNFDLSESLSPKELPREMTDIKN